MALKASGDDDMEYREMTAKIAKRIDDYTLEELKYQCRDVIGPGKLEKVSSAQNLFEILEERDEINLDEVEFLQKILKNVDRIDLCKIVKSYADTRSEASSEPSVENVSSLNPMPSLHGEVGTMPSKFFSQDDPESNPPKSSQTTYQVQAASERENCTVPFDTSGDTRGGYFVPHHANPQPVNPAHVGGHAISPQLSTALEFVISQISRGWQSAARHLGVPDVVIDSAEANWPRNIRNQIGEAFRYWSRNDRQASLPKLIQALRHVGRNDIADDLEHGIGQ